MEVIIGMQRLALGGAESYAMTLAEQLERLGHPTVVHTLEVDGPAAELAQRRGLKLAVGDHAPPVGVDTAITQDSATAYVYAGRYPEARRAFVAHSVTDMQTPPLLDGVAPTAVALNGRIASRLRALGGPFDLLRLRQPIDIGRLRPRGTVRRRPRRVLALGNHLAGARFGMLAAACDTLGLELTRVGRHGDATVAPEAAIAEADIVVGYGRSILEAMALGRPAYVWDHGGGDGWVTPETYPQLEADGFSGAATSDVIDTARLTADLADYRPELGELGFDLVRLHHAATKHAESLVAAMSPSAPAAGRDALQELGRLARAQWRAAGRAEELALESRSLREHLEAQWARADAAERALSELRATRRYRLATALARPIDHLRARLPARKRS